MSRLPFSLFLASRYLRPKRSFLSVITVISTLGVVLGITVLMLVISVMTGFGLELKRKIIGFDAHMVVVTRDMGILPDWREVQAAVEKRPGVVAASPFMIGPVIAEFEGRIATPKMRGVDPESEPRISEIRDTIIEGAYDLEGEKTVIGFELARQMKVTVGDRITVYAPSNFDEFLGELNALSDQTLDEETAGRLRRLVLPQELEVTGIFRSGRYVYDSEYLFVPIWLGQELYRLGDGVHGVAIKTVDAYRADQMKPGVEAALSEERMVMTWSDLNSQFLEAVLLERNVMFILLFFIVIVAAFMIMNTLIIVTVQKTREIGIMKALGARPSQIIWVFLSQGMVVGAIGVVLGVISGITLVHWRNEVRTFLADIFGLRIFPQEVYQFAEIPAEVIPADVAIICVSAFLICTLASLVPAWVAARLDPVKALRQE